MRSLDQNVVTHWGPLNHLKLVQLLQMSLTFSEEGPRENTFEFWLAGPYEIAFSIVCADLVVAWSWLIGLGSPHDREPRCKSAVTAQSYAYWKITIANPA